MSEPSSMPTDDETLASEGIPIDHVAHLDHAHCVVQLRGVSHVYSGSGSPVHALSDIDCELESGTLTVLIGANGSGKSTLLRILAALLVPTQGEVEILGQRLPFSSKAAEEQDFRSRVAFISQALAIDPEMTGGEILTLLATLHGVPRRERAKRITALADRFGLQALLPRLVQTYSGGQSRRLHVAAGMLTDPEFLLLDEPTAGLDAEGSSLVWKELQQRTQRGQTVVLVTHDLLRVQEYADRVVLLHEGKCIADATPEALTGKLGGDVPVAPLAEPALARVYRELTGQEVAQEAERVRPGQGPGGTGKGRGQWRR
jgi:ABC-2 type transport system ATP-binding protein